MSVRCKVYKLPSGQKGILMFEMDSEDKDAVAWIGSFLRDHRAKEDEKGERVPLTIEIDYWQPLRTPSQWRLAMELLDRYCAKNRVDRANTWAGVKYETYPDVGPIGKKVKKASADLTKGEMSTVIDHLVNRCLETNVDIRDIWTLWRKWRFSQDRDPLEGRENKADRVLCEACGKPLNVGTDAAGNQQRGGQKAHIISKGAGGPDEEWNLPDLCTECHMIIQHQHGWEELIEKHPAFKERYDYARRRYVESGEGQASLPVEQGELGLENGR